MKASRTWSRGRLLARYDYGWDYWGLGFTVIHTHYEHTLDIDIGPLEFTLGWIKNRDMVQRFWRTLDNEESMPVDDQWRNDY